MYFEHLLMSLITLDNQLDVAGGSAPGLRDEAGNDVTHKSKRWRTHSGGAMDSLWDQLPFEHL